jgi:Kdo2-lipid IVA lauroyltransferase/acyltransferase
MLDLYEFLYFPKLSSERLKKILTFINPEIVSRSLDKGRGVLFLSAHLSNWELTAFAYPKIFNTPLNIIAKKQANKSINKKINEYRKLSGNEIIEIGYSLKEIFIKLNENKIVCFLIDQSANPDYSVYVNFFGVKTATFAGPAKIALKLKPAMIFAYGIRTEDLNYNIYFEEIEYTPEPGIDNVEALTQLIQKKLEDVIRKYPEQWVWFHRRFKHRKDA